jgi:hypothetical protein
MARDVSEKIVAAKRRTDPANKPFRGHFTIWVEDDPMARDILRVIAEAAVEEGVMISWGLD